MSGAEAVIVMGSEAIVGRSLLADQCWACPRESAIGISRVESSDMWLRFEWEVS